MEGTCGLCHEARTLRLSHYIPAGIFKTIAGARGERESAPILVDAIDGVAIRTNDQPRKHFLCQECEQRFDRNGESKVISQCHRSANNFKLRTILNSCQPHAKTSDASAVFYGHQLSEIVDVAAYQYFAASIAWRGSAADWGGTYSVYRGALGAIFEEQFRLYLLGKAAFPKRCALFIFVNSDEALLGLSTTPAAGREEVEGQRIHRHSFLIPGLRFVLLVGGNAMSLRNNSTLDEAAVTFFEWQFSGSGVEQTIRSAMRGVTAKGSLARR